jgi:hypothetical protein
VGYSYPEIELCDGAVTFVEENVAEYVDNEGRYDG